MSFRKAKIDLSDEGLFIVDGKVSSSAFDSNGAGKSNLFEALTWVLFGKTIKGVSSNEVINNTAKSNCYVSIEIFDGDNEYKIIRTRKHNNYGSSLRLITNGEGRTQHSKVTTQDEIRRTIGLEYKSFTNSIIFGQGNIERFSTATDAKRKEILEELLNLEYLPEAQKKIKSKLNLKYDRIKVLQRNEEEIKRNIINIEESWVSIKRELEFFKNEKYLKIINQIDLILELDEIIYDLDCIVLPHIDNDNFNEIESNAAETLRRYDDAYTLLEKRPDNSECLIRLRRDIDYIHASISRITQIRQTVMGTSGGVCKSCSQKITKAIVKKQIKELDVELSEEKNKLSKINKKIKRLQKTQDERDKLVDQLEILKRIYSKAEEVVGEVIIQRGLRGERIKRLGDLERTQIRNLRTLAEISVSRFGMNIQGALVDSLILRELELRGIQELIDSIEVETYYLEFWVKGFSNSGIKANILDSVMPFLNERAGVYSDILTDGQIEVKFVNEKKLRTGDTRDKLEVSCKRIGGGNSYKAISGGEKKRTDMVQALALRDLVASRSNQSIDFMFMDECFEALDKTGTDRAMDLLGELSRKCKRIYVATHISTLKSSFPQNITIINKNGESTIA